MPVILQNPGQVQAPPQIPTGDPAVGAFPTGGSAADMLRFLTGQAYQNSQSVPAVTPFDPALWATNQGFLANANTSVGLSPEAQTAMRTEATAGLQDRYNQAAGALRTGLLQRGMYGGGIPANSGAMLNAFGPLQASMADAQSGAARQTVMADEQARTASLLANRQLAAQAVGMGTTMTMAQNQAEMSRYTAQAQAMSQAIQAAGGLSSIEATSFKNILLASMLSSGAAALARPGTLEAIIKAVKGGGAVTPDLTTVPNGTNQVENLPGSIGTIAGLGGAGVGAAAGLGGPLAGIMAGAVPSIPLAATGAATASTAGLATLSSTVPGAAGAGAGAGMGATLGAFFTNPITIGVGAALAGALIWKQSQVHPTASTFVKQFQDPFANSSGTGHLNKVVDAFDQAYATGGMTADQAQLAYDQVESLIQGFEASRTEFSRKGSKERTVADQAKRRMEEVFGPGYERVLTKMQQAVTLLRGVA